MSADKKQASQEQHRRQFLKWLAASPLLAAPGASDLFAQDSLKRADPMIWATTPDTEMIKTPKDAINVFDFEAVARQKVPPAHFGYMASGIDDEVTLRANRTAFEHWQLRPRRLRDVSRVDMSVTLFGTRWNTPIIIAPTGGNKAYDPEGEVAVARACKAGGHLNILSGAGALPIEEVVAARGGEVWFQLYATSSFDVAAQVARRMEKAGVPVMEITVDRNGGRNQETFQRLRRLDTRVCASCHTAGIGAARDRPNYDGIDLSGVKSMQSANLTWDFIKKMREVTKMKLVLKGIVTEEDAQLCLKYGVDGVHVSNHGGRAEDSGRGAIDALPEVAKVLKGKMPILFDSGVRRGTDVFKAMALGASAICIGRPYLWGLGAFGQPGVERVLQILREEYSGVMQQMGAVNTAAIVPAMIKHA
ncbi:MAG TPA: alpha-hydroxy acid oxidase [Burkholderiales bacterium]|nr:alpha-hydroxy acid oxidase [Burkholderiales bacterium]